MSADNKIQKLLDTAIYYLETINEDNFDYKIKKLSQIAHTILEEKQKYFSEELPNEQLLETNELFKEKAKLLKGKFDNLIENKQKEAELVSRKLNKLSNQKKLAIYNR